MANQIQKKVNKSIKKNRLNKLIMRHQQEASVLKKLIFHPISTPIKKVM